MLIFIIIFLLATPASSMDLFNRLFGKKEAAPRLPLRIIYEEDKDISEAIQRSLNSSYDVDPVCFSEWVYHQESFDESLPKRLESPLELALGKARQSPSELAFLWGLDSQNVFINLAGYMMLVKARVPLMYTDLTRHVAKEGWRHVFEVLHLGSFSASHLFMLQDQMREFLSTQSDHSPLLDDWAKKMDSISLDLVSGKWGFSKRKATPKVIVKLQSGIESIGARMGKRGVSPGRFVTELFTHFNQGRLLDRIKSPLLKRYRLFVFSQVANGYLHAFPHRERQFRLEQLAKKARPFFTLKDLQGYSLEDLLQDSKGTLEKIDKASRIMPHQQDVFKRFVAPLKGLASKDELYQLRAFLSTFDLYSLDVEKEQRRLGLLQAVLQDKPTEEIHGILAQLVDNEFLPEDIMDIEPLLVEAAHYETSASYDRLYGRVVEKIREARKGGAEPKLWSKQKVMNQGLQLWLRDYFNAFHKAAYIPRSAYFVEYEGILEGERMESGTEITERQAEIASNHMAAYTAINDLKAVAFPEVKAGHKAVFQLTGRGAKVDLVDEDDNKVISTKELDSGLYGGQFYWIGEIMSQYEINPNVLPAGVKRMTVPSDTPLKPHYAIRGGAGIDEVQMIKGRGVVIDSLIRRGRIDRSLKLPILLYMYGW